MAYGNEKKNKRSAKDKKLLGAAEAIVFCQWRPVSVSHMAQVLEISESAMEELMDCLMEEYNQGRAGHPAGKAGTAMCRCAPPVNMAKPCAKRWKCAGTSRFPRRPWKFWR